MSGMKESQISAEIDLLPTASDKAPQQHGLKPTISMNFEVHPYAIVNLSVSPSVCMSICLSIYLSVCLSICLCVCSLYTILWFSGSVCLLWSESSLS